MRDISVYQRRRQALMASMQQGVAILATGGEQERNGGTHFPFRFNSAFYYLTGFTEPEAVLVLVAGETPRSILFCRAKDPEREVWEGRGWGPEAAREAFALDEAYPLSELDRVLPSLLANQLALYTPLGQSAGWDARVAGWVNQVRAEVRKGITAPETWHDIRGLIDEMRVIKDDSEITALRRAAEISAAAHRRALLATRPGVFEYQIEAELLHEFVRHGARHPAYPSIVASGENACVLHYVDNQRQMQAGDLLLIDAGCEWLGYAGDITRTFPVGPRFTPAQRAVYECVLAAQLAAIAAVGPDQHWNAPHEAALSVLSEGLLDMGLLKGSLDEVLETERYKRFYMHRTGHWLGLDVHDVGQYKQQGQWRALQPGMVLTVEPGLYIRAADDIPAEFHGIGVRIEDDVLVTAGGCEVLTAAAPKSVAELESLRDDAAGRA